MADDTTNSPSTTEPAPPGSGTGSAPAPPPSGAGTAPAPPSSGTGSAPAPAGTGAASGPADPRAELNRLKDRVRTSRDQIDQMTKAAAADDQDITVLESGLNEVDSVVKAFGQGIQAIGDQASIRTFLDQKSNMAVAAVANGKSALDAISAGLDADIKTQSQSVAALQTASDQAASAHSTALATATQKQATYQVAKGTLSRIQAGVADITNLKTQINSAAESGNFGSMYLLVGEMRSAVNALAAPTPAALQAQLSTALLDLRAALSDVRTKKDTADKAQAALGAAQKKLNDAVAGRARRWWPRSRTGRRLLRRKRLPRRKRPPRRKRLPRRKRPPRRKRRRRHNRLPAQPGV